MSLAARIRKPIGALVVDGALRRTHWALRRRLRQRGASDAPGEPGPEWLEEANTALRTKARAEEALEEVRRLGLPPHPDPPKNWDALIGLAFLLSRTGPDARILDAGAAPYSVMLPWLYLFGYRDLVGIDLMYRRPRRRGPIRYEPGDLTGTRFPDGSFDAVTCMSVIEHGVDIEAYVREMARILKPGGGLVTSTDYWPDPIDTGDRMAFGVPVKVFSRNDIEKLLSAAERYGFRTTTPVNLDAEERAVHWSDQNLDYTFLILTMDRRTD